MGLQDRAPDTQHLSHAVGRHPGILA